MHDLIYKFFDNLENNFPVSDYKDHSSKNPVPYTIIDNFLSEEIYNEILKDIDRIAQNNFTTFENSNSRRLECRDFKTSYLIKTLSNCFQSSKFIYWIEQISGINKLIPDPHLRGAGFARVLSGEKLGLHTDFNWNDQLSLNRKVNLILYLTPNWQKDWNGDLEFWNKDGSECQVKIEPKQNRLVFWNYETWLIHGHSETLKTPENIGRDSLISFYYSSNATWEEAPRRSKFL
jgi:hypothetical protein